MADRDVAIPNPFQMPSFHEAEWSERCEHSRIYNGMYPRIVYLFKCIAAEKRLEEFHGVPHD